MKEEKLSYLEPITNGSKLLTEYFGDDSWMDRINPDFLMMSEPYSCVLGQLFGNYWNGMTEIGLDRNGNGAPWGFDITFDDGVYRHLTQAWREYLSQAKQKEQVIDVLEACGE